ncbi:MAG: DUF433 domain-containing protein [Cytophagales bacterium]|nr:DUF433 domain-containing protein [Cytophagales bacterium]
MNHEFILSLYGSGWSEKQIIESYPHLTCESLRALFLYVQECMKEVESDKEICKIYGNET